MPEQLTKHPGVTLEVLKSAGAKCGEGATQAILKSCPAERFCALPGGEICVYGLPDAARMTQIAPGELAAAAGVAPLPPAQPPPAAAQMPWPWLGVALLAGAALGAWLSRARR